MDIEKNLLSEKKQITPKYVLDVCQRFADALLDGQWFDSENREVTITRSFTEVIGHSSDMVFAGEPVREIKLRTEVSFSGEKEVTEEFDDGGVALEEFYTISAKVSEVVHHSALPAHVLSKLADLTKVVDYIDDDEDDEDEREEEESDVAARTKLTPAMLNAFLLEHEYEIGYVIDEDGEPANYYVTVRYLANKKTIDESHYGWNDNDSRTSFLPTAFKDKDVLEWKSAYQTELDEADIAEFLNSFEQIIQDVIDVEQFEALKEDLISEEDEHYRRVLAIIALTAANFKHIKL